MCIYKYSYLPTLISSLPLPLNICHCRLLIIFSIACAAFSIGNFTAGIVVDRYGPTVTAVVHSILIPVAMLCIGFASAEQYGLFMLGGVCLGLGGSFILLNSFPLAFLSDDKEESAFIMTAANCLFDASASVFLPVYILYHDAKLTRQEIFGGLAAISLILSCIVILPLWFIVEYRPSAFHLPEVSELSSPSLLFEESLENSRLPAPNKLDNLAVELVDQALTRTDDINAVVDLALEIPAPPSAAQVGLMSASVPLSAAVARIDGDKGVELELGQGSSRGDCMHGVENILSHNEGGEGEGEGETEVAWTAHLLGTKFWFITILYTLQSLRTVVYMVVVLSVLKDLGDEHHGFVYTQVYAAGLSSGFLFVGLIHRTYSSLGMHATFHVVNALGYVWGIVTLIPVLELQILGFFAFYMYRAYLYSLVGMYFADVFGPGLSGRLYGAANLFCGAALLIQYPAYHLTAVYANSNYNYLNIATLALNVVCTVLVEVAYPLAATTTKLSSTPSKTSDLLQKQNGTNYESCCCAEETVVGTGTGRGTGTGAEIEIEIDTTNAPDTGVLV